MNNIHLDDYMALIVDQAKIALEKIKKPSIYDLQDLVQEGVVVFCKIRKKYNSDRATFCTMFTTCLKNRYCDLVWKSYKEFSPLESDIGVTCSNIRFSSHITLNLEDKLFKLSFLEILYIRLCVSPSEEMVKELLKFPMRRRVILRRVLNITEDDEFEIRNHIRKVLVEEV